MSEAIVGMPPAPPPPRPRDAAIAVVVRSGAKGREVLWVKRARGLSFGSGFHAFPGGRVEAGDADVPVGGSEGLERALRVAAARELFEETGLLLAEGPPLSVDATNAARAALREGRESFGALLSRLGRSLPAHAFRDAGRWITPPSYPVRFDARLYLVEIVPDVPPLLADIRELDLAEWISPASALSEWSAGRVVLHAPVLHALEVLGSSHTLEEAAGKMALAHDTAAFVSNRLEYQKGIRAVPLLTPTLPPAAHTNTYVVGNGELLVVDPGASDLRECARLFAFIETLKAEGKRPKAVVLTHHHADHVGGALWVSQRLKIPVLCHARTADRLDFKAQQLVDEGDLLTLAGTPPMRWRVVHTPGHARGHICLLDESSRAALVGDMVAGVGTILIDPPEGDMTDYLAQLARLRELPVGVLYPAHGPPLPDGRAALEEYRLHRERRERQVVAAILHGNGTLSEIARAAYSELPPEAAPMTERSTQAILIKLIRDGRVVRSEERYLRGPAQPPQTL